MYTIRVFLGLVLIALSYPSWLSGEPRQERLAFTGVCVIPMASEEPVRLDHQTVVVERDRIVAVGPVEEVPLPAGAHVVEGEGRCLIPGLIDSHVHLREPEASLILFPAFGVTTVRNMQGSEEHLELRRRLEQGRLWGPTLYTSGPYVEDLLEGPEDVERVVRSQKAAGYDVLKVHGDVSEKTWRRLVETAAAEDMDVVGHAPRNLDFSVVLDSPPAELSHAEEYLYTWFAEDVENPRGVEAVARATAEAGIRVVPTLVTFDTIVAQATDEFYSLLRKPELVWVSPERRGAWRRDSYREYIGADELPWWTAARRLLKRLTGALHRAGVPLAAGTDTPLEFLVPGAALHDELELLVEAGLSPYEALRAATFEGAKALRATDRLGSVEVGKQADLVLLDGDPRRQIGATRRIEGVMVRGRWLDRRQIDRRLDALASRYARQAVELRARQETQDRLVDLARKKGPEAAADRLAQLRRSMPRATHVDEAILNRLGYRYLRAGRTEDAVAVFRLNVAAFPHSANVYDSLGEAYRETGNRDQSIRCYQRALEIDPDLESAQEALSELRSGDP